MKVIHFQQGERTRCGLKISNKMISSTNVKDATCISCRNLYLWDCWKQILTGKHQVECPICKFDLNPKDLLLINENSLPKNYDEIVFLCPICESILYCILDEESNPVILDHKTHWRLKELRWKFNSNILYRKYL